MNSIFIYILSVNYFNSYCVDIILLLLTFKLGLSTYNI